MTPRGLALLIALVAATQPARAELAPGDKCKLSGSITVKLRESHQGAVETELDRGTRIVVVDPGRIFARITVGDDVEALAPADALEAVCSVPRERCVLEGDLKMATEDSATAKSKVFKVKAGATVTVLERDKKRARVMVGGVIGRMNRMHLDEKCRRLAPGAAPPAADEGEGEAGDEAAVAAPNPYASVEKAPDGTRVAVIAFAIARDASALEARSLEDTLVKALLERRGDVMPPRDPRPSASERLVEPKQHWENAKLYGSAVGVPFVITGHLSRDGDKNSLSLSVIDVQKGRVLRTIRVRPTFHEEDPWAAVSSGHLQEMLPGGQKYVPPKKAEAPPPPPPPPPVRGTYEEKAWFQNGLAYTALGAGALFAAGGAATGFWASTDLGAVRAAPVTSEGRADAANAALAKAIVADGLYASAALAAALSVAFFVTGLDWDGV